MAAPNFFSWIGNVTGGMVIGVDSIDDLVDIIKASAAKDSGHLDDLEEKMKATSSSKLKLIEVARKAEHRCRHSALHVLGAGFARRWTSEQFAISIHSA